MTTKNTDDMIHWNVVQHSTQIEIFALCKYNGKNVGEPITANPTAHSHSSELFVSYQVLDAMCFLALLENIITVNHYSFTRNIVCQSYSFN